MLTTLIFFIGKLLNISIQCSFMLLLFALIVPSVWLLPTSYQEIKFFDRRSCLMLIRRFILKAHS